MGTAVAEERWQGEALAGAWPPRALAGVHAL